MFSPDSNNFFSNINSTAGNTAWESFKANRQEVMRLFLVSSPAQEPPGSPSQLNYSQTLKTFKSGKRSQSPSLAPKSTRNRANSNPIRQLKRLTKLPKGSPFAPVAPPSQPANTTLLGLLQRDYEFLTHCQNHLSLCYFCAKYFHAELTFSDDPNAYRSDASGPNYLLKMAQIEHQDTLKYTELLFNNFDDLNANPPESGGGQPNAKTLSDIERAELYINGKRILVNHLTEQPIALFSAIQPLQRKFILEYLNQQALASMLNVVIGDPVVDENSRSTTFLKAGKTIYKIMTDALQGNQISYDLSILVTEAKHVLNDTAEACILKFTYPIEVILSGNLLLEQATADRLKLIPKSPAVLMLKSGSLGKPLTILSDPPSRKSIYALLESEKISLKGPACMADLIFIAGFIQNSIKKTLAAVGNKSRAPSPLCSPR